MICLGTMTDNYIAICSPDYVIGKQLKCSTSLSRGLDQGMWPR